MYTSDFGRSFLSRVGSVDVLVMMQSNLLFGMLNVSPSFVDDWRFCVEELMKGVSCIGRAPITVISGLGDKTQASHIRNAEE